LLAGHVCCLLGDYQKAQNLFLSSSEAIAALYMRRDLLHWDQVRELSGCSSCALVCVVCVVSTIV
jgi:WD repeat-containing protein 19